MAQRSGFILPLLARLAMYERVPRPQLAELARTALVSQAAAGARIARRGERLPGLMIVRYGLVQLALVGNIERVLRLVGAGETFGEAALFLELPLPVEVSAVTESALVTLPAGPLLALFDGDSRFARSLMASLCQRLHMLVMDFEAVTVHGARERLAAYLCSLGGDAAYLPAPKRVIASRLGMTKETLSRLLRAFIDEGLIGVRRRQISLLDRDRLAAVATASASSRA